MKILPTNQINWDTLEENRDILSPSIVHLIELCEKGQIGHIHHIPCLLYDSKVCFRYHERLQIVEISEDLWHDLLVGRFSDRQISPEEVHTLDKEIIIVLQHYFDWKRIKDIYLKWFHP